jgi:hypothetical protein
VAAGFAAKCRSYLAGKFNVIQLCGESVTRCVEIAFKAALSFALMRIQVFRRSCEVNLRLAMFLSLVIAILPRGSSAQLVASSAPAPDNAVIAIAPHTSPLYVRPSQAKMAHDYALDAFGPYAVVASAATAGLNQMEAGRRGLQQTIRL